MQKYTKEFLEPIVKECRCISDVCRAIGLQTHGGANTRIGTIIKSYNIDTAHFNRYLPTENNKKSWQHFLVLSDKAHRTHRVPLKRSMIEYGIPYKCNCCGATDIWNNKILILEIDHINENGLDNRPENLQFLCPNCHSQKTVKTIDRRIIKQEFVDAYKRKKLEEYKHLFDIVYKSNINMRDKGSMKKLATLLNMKPQYINRWLKKWMPDYFNSFIGL